MHYQSQSTLMIEPPSHELDGDVVDSLAHGKFEWNFKFVIFTWNLVIEGWGISCEIALTWMSLAFTDDQSILVQVMAWCHQATSHYLSQCWPRSLPPYGITRPQWVDRHWPIRPIWPIPNWHFGGSDLFYVFSQVFSGQKVLRNLCNFSITWASADSVLCHHMASVSHNELDNVMWIAKHNVGNYLFLRTDHV